MRDLVIGVGISYAIPKKKKKKEPTMVGLSGNRLEPQDSGLIKVGDLNLEGVIVVRDLIIDVGIPCVIAKKEEEEGILNRFA